MYEKELERINKFRQENGMGHGRGNDRKKDILGYIKKLKEKLNDPEV